jgi:hypothetical protein
MNNLKTFENFAGLESDVPEKGKIYKVYKQDGKLEYSAIKFEGPDSQGNKFTVLSRMKPAPIWIKDEEMKNFIFRPGTWNEKKKK